MRFKHSINCTWCMHRKSIKPKRKKSGVNEVELCKLDVKRIPHPREAGRWCERFQYPDCDCEICQKPGN